MSNKQVPYVDDQGNSDQHMLTRSIGGNSADIPLTRPSTDQLNFGGSSTGTIFDEVSPSDAGNYSDEINCDGASWIVIRSEFEKINGVAVLRPIWRDAHTNGGWHAGEEDLSCKSQNQKNATGYPALADTTYYLGRRLAIPTYGAKSVRFVLISVSTGKFSGWAAAV